MTSAVNTVETAFSPVTKAIRAAAQATGVGFDYLVTTATRESSLNPAARASTSSASGLFQFTDSTWLNVMKDHGGEHGFATEAASITQTLRGPVIEDPAMRQHVMDLRMNADANALMAGAFTADNSAYLSSTLARQPTTGELYIAHFMGARGAGELISQAGASPDAPAADYFPKAASANKSIFYSNGQKKSLSEVYASLTAQHTNSPLEAQKIASAEAFVTPAIAATPATASAAAPASENTLFRSMFTPRRVSGVSPVVTALWTRPQSQTAPAGPVLPAVSRPFFPTSSVQASEQDDGSQGS